mmetsp:Transcript_3040/g.6959  ORF Transcript_3040/g.6959 Transcript_3040/m.6959 type:complete len:83 (+) Transcript_3040:49-297(+)
MFADIRRLQALLYPGDMDLPKVTDCDKAGECHHWSGNAYLDSWARVGTNWDMIGGEHAENHIHFDSFADDAWVANTPPPLFA